MKKLQFTQRRGNNNVNKKRWKNIAQINLQVCIIILQFSLSHGGY